MGFFAKMMDSTNPTVSSKTFLMIAGGFIVLISAIIIAMVSVIKAQGVPAGVSELLIALFLILVTGKAVGGIFEAKLPMQIDPTKTYTALVDKTSESAQ